MPSSALLQFLGGWRARAAQGPLGCLNSGSSWARGTDAALECLYCLHWVPLEKNPKQPPSVQNLNLLKTAGTVLGEHSIGESSSMALALSRNEQLQAGYKQIASRLQAGYKQVTEVPYGLTARGANLLQQSESTCFPGLTAEKNV